MKTSAYKRLKLVIAFQKPNRILFTLSELRGESTEIIRGTRHIPSLDFIKQMAQEWHRYLSQTEDEFWSKYREAVYASIHDAEKKGLKTIEDIRAYILSDNTWRQAITSASDSFMRDVGTLVHDFSLGILFDLLPEEEKFWKIFSDTVDKPSCEVFNTDKTSWLNIPLLQIQIEGELLAIPWWISRTHDHKSIWCCRYALGVSPTLRDIQPPDLQFKDLNILTLTRPTFDLQPWCPINREMIELVDPFISENSLRWRLIDGVLGDHLQPRADSVFGQKTDLGHEFIGISKNQARSALRTHQAPPNFIFYQGHWRNSIDEPTTENGPYVFFDSKKKPSEDKRTRTSAMSAIETLHLPVPLLSIIPPQLHRDSILIMNACGSASHLDQGNYIEQYVDEHSVFVGTTYPLLADPIGSSARTFLKNVFEKPGDHFLAHSLLDAQRLDKNLETEPDLRELYKKASLCLFGDVRTHLKLKFNTATKDNVSPLIIKITDRWKKSFEKLGFHHFQGMTYSLEETNEYPPTYKFLLEDKGVQIALAPLAIAIDLCLDDPGNYVILGPAFASKKSVSLASKSIVSLDNLTDQLKLCLKNKQHLRVGILKPRLTTTYMVKSFIANQIPKEGAQEESLRYIIKYESAYWEGKMQNMISAEFLSKVDITLILNEDIERGQKIGLNFLVDDIETVAAQILKIPFLPRGVFLTRRKCLRNEEDKTAIKEFFDKYNDSITQFKTTMNKTYPTDSLKDIPLHTFDQSNGRYLNVIKLFAESGFLAEFSIFDWNNFAYRPVISPNSAQAIISNMSDYLDDELRKNIGADIDKISIELIGLQKRLKDTVIAQKFWLPDGFRSLIEDGLAKCSQLTPSLKDNIKKNLFQRMESLDLEITPVN